MKGGEVEDRVKATIAVTQADFDCLDRVATLLGELTDDPALGKQARQAVVEVDALMERIEEAE